MKNKKWFMGVALSAIFMFVAFVPAVSAGVADCTFEHGNSGAYGYGKTYSTKVESSMKNVIYVSYTDANESYSKTGTSGNSSYCEVWTSSLTGRTGNHSCEYYVNGAHAHTSTSLWPF